MATTLHTERGEKSFHADCDLTVSSWWILWGYTGLGKLAVGGDVRFLNSRALNLTAYITAGSLEVNLMLSF